VSLLIVLLTALLSSVFVAAVPIVLVATLLLVFVFCRKAKLTEWRLSRIVTCGDTVNRMCTEAGFEEVIVVPFPRKEIEKRMLGFYRPLSSWGGPERCVVNICAQAPMRHVRVVSDQNG